MASYGLKTSCLFAAVVSFLLSSGHHSRTFCDFGVIEFSLQWLKFHLDNFCFKILVVAIVALDYLIKFFVIYLDMKMERQITVIAF